MEENRLRTRWISSIESAAEDLKETLRTARVLDINLFQQKGSVEGPGTASDCVIVGTVKLGAGSRLIACYVGENASLVVGENTVMVGCHVCSQGQVIVGDNAVLWDVEFNEVRSWCNTALLYNNVNIGSNSIIINSEIRQNNKVCSIRIGEGARMYYGCIKCDCSASIPWDCETYLCDIGPGFLNVYFMIEQKLKSKLGIHIGKDSSFISNRDGITTLINPQCELAYMYNGARCASVEWTIGRCVIGERFSIFSGSNRTHITGGRIRMGNDVTVYGAGCNLMINYKSIEVGDNVMMCGDARPYIERGPVGQGENPRGTNRLEQRQCSMTIGSGATVVFSMNDMWMSERGKLASSNIYVPAGERYIAY